MKIRDNHGVFLGAGPGVDRLTLLRVVFEGVAYSPRHNLEDRTGGEGNRGRIKLIGGGSKRSIWPRILPDVRNVKAWVLDLSGDVPTVGAAFDGVSLLAIGGRRFISRSIAQRFQGIRP